MASQVGRLVQDQNLNVHFNGASVVGKGDAFKKTQRKGGLGVGGRKPLGDLSNSGKPALTQASKKQPSKNVSLLDEVTNVPKIIHGASSLKGSSKTSAKVQTRSRKALSDISNSVKPHVQHKHNTKLSVVEEEPLSPSAITEEGFLHNHEECIKAQTKAIDVDEFLMTLGLHNDSLNKFISPWEESPLSSKFEPESPRRSLDLEELSEHESSWMSDNLASSPCKSPELPIHYTDSPWMIWEDCDFKLREAL